MFFGWPKPFAEYAHKPCKKESAKSSKVSNKNLSKPDTLTDEEWGAVLKLRNAKNKDVK